MSSQHVTYFFKVAYITINLQWNLWNNILSLFLLVAEL